MSVELAVEKEGIIRWGIVGTLIWSTIIAAIFLLTQIITMGVYIGLFYRVKDLREYQGLMSTLQYNGYVLSLCTFATLLICGGLVAGIIKLKKGTRIKDYLGLQGVKLRTFFFWLIITIIFMVLSDGLSIVLGLPVVPEFMMKAYSSIDRVWLLWLALLVAAPVLEEVFFRGFLFGGLSSSFAGPIGAILLSSLAWSAIHLQYDWYGMATIFVLGLIFGAARYASGSLILTMSLHSLVNLASTIQTAIRIGT